MKKKTKKESKPKFANYEDLGYLVEMIRLLNEGCKMLHVRICRMEESLFGQKRKQNSKKVKRK